MLEIFLSMKPAVQAVMATPPPPLPLPLPLPSPPIEAIPNL
jgi:hypothetical protein